MRKRQFEQKLNVRQKIKLNNGIKTLKVVTGIGDNLWMFQKLINTNEKFNFKIAGEDPYKRVTVLYDVLPQLINSYIYDNSFNTNIALKNNIQDRKKNWSDIKENEFYLTINKHLEEGKRIEDWFPDLPIIFDMTKYYDTFKYKEQCDNLLNDKNQKYIGIYMSSYSTSRHWGFWNEKEWFALISSIHKIKPNDYTFVIIGADYDLDLTTSLIKYLDAVKIRYINTIGNHLGLVIEIMKKLIYGFYFPSGIGILAATLSSPHTMFFPEHLKLMINTFQDPILIKEDKAKHCLFCKPEVIFKWWKDEYKGFD